MFPYNIIWVIESLEIDGWFDSINPWQVTLGNANHANSSPSDLQVNSWTALIVDSFHPALKEALGAWKQMNLTTPFFLGGRFTRGSELPTPFSSSSRGKLGPSIGANSCLRKGRGPPATSGEATLCCFWPEHYKWFVKLLYAADDYE